MAEAPISVPSWKPTTVITGISALRSAWRDTTTLLRSPLARAVRTKSWPSTSSIVVRVIRITIAINWMASASAGRIICCRLPNGSSNGEM